VAASVAVAGVGQRGSPLPGGSAIPSMGGGDFMSPMERTDQQIKRLIKRLG
jgi:hypothetical protein